jgi:glycosyltransferase involved in cell wall biosynthesis
MGIAWGLWRLRRLFDVSDGERTADSIVFVTAGDPDRLTGGYLYNRRMLEAMRRVGYDIYETSLPTDAVPLAAASLLSLLNECCPDLVIVDSIATAELAATLPWRGELADSRLLALMHTLPSDLYAASQLNSLRQQECAVLHAADMVISVSAVQRQRFIALGVAPERVQVVMPGRDALAWPQLPVERRPQVTLLCVANWSPSKGIHILVEALGQLKGDVHLELAGEEGHGPYAEYVRALIERHGLAERVHRQGVISGEPLAQLYAVADVFVLPSSTEGFATVWAEAAEFGLPIVAGQIEQALWMLEEGCGWLVPANDAQALACALNRLVEDTGQRRRMSEAVQRSALHLPTWRQSSDQFCQLVRTVLTSARKSNITD